MFGDHARHQQRVTSGLVTGAERCYFLGINDGKTVRVKQG